jgi:osmotically-inducible protein OsmY
MTHSTRNTFAHKSAAAVARWGPWLAIFALAWLFSSPLAAAGIDLELEAKVHRALIKNDELKKSSVFVRVWEGTATLTGTVSSAELKREALRLAQNVEGVLAVRGESLYVAPSTRRPPLTIVLPLEDRPTQTRAASPSLPRPDMAATVAVPSPRPTAIERPAQSITLLAPEAAVSIVRTPEPAQLTAHPRLKPSAVSLAEALENLRRKSSRFQDIRTVTRDATVYIYPGSASSDDTMTFAQAVRKMPGVRQVVVAPRSR